MRAALLVTLVAVCTAAPAPRYRPEEPLSNLQLLVRRPVGAPPLPPAPTHDNDESGYERDDESSAEPLMPLFVEREPSGTMTGKGGAAAGPFAVVVMPNRSEGRGGALYAACARLLTRAGARGGGTLDAVARAACSLYVAGGGGAGDRGDDPAWRRSLMLLGEDEPGLVNHYLKAVMKRKSQRAFDPRFKTPFK